MPKGGSGSVKYFTGIPIPSSLGLTAFMAGCVKMGKFAGAQGWAMSVVHKAAQVAAVDWPAVRKQGDLPGGMVLLFGEHGGVGEMHLLSLVFLAWGAAMVSKTLKVSSAPVPKSRTVGTGLLIYSFLDVIGSQAVELASADERNPYRHSSERY